MKHKKYLLFSSKIALILYILLIIYYVFCWYNVRIVHDGKRNQVWHYNHYVACTNYISTSSIEKKEEIISDYDYLGIDDETCNKLVSYGTPADSVFNKFEEFFDEENFVFPFFAPIIVLLPFIYLFSKQMKNKTIKNYCLRDDYKNYVRYIFKTAYKNIFIIPLIVIITFVISYIFANGNLNPSADIGLNLVLPNLAFIDNPIFPIMYLFTLVCAIGVYINIGLIVMSRNKNFIISLLESEIVIFLIWCFSIIGLGRFFKIFGINPDNFNLLSIYDWVNIDNMGIFVGLNIIMFVITLIIAILSYKNKEKIIIMCER